MVVALFAVSWFLRGDEPGHVPRTLALLLGLVAALLATGTGWLGGELVDRLGVGVDPDAHLDAPASFATGIRFSRADGTSRSER